MPSPATSARLPQELIDSVIDELKHDVGSLRACSLVSKPWVYRSRRYLFATVHLPTCLLRKWLERVPADPNINTPLDPHHHVRSLSLQPATTSAPFCIPETFVDHLSSFTQVSTLAIGSSLRKEWTDPFSDSALVAKYFGGLGQSLRKLELTRVHLNMAVLKALLDVFPLLEQILIFSPMMVDEEAKSVEVFPPYLRERRNGQGPSDVVRQVPCEKVSTRQVNNLTLLFPPGELVVGLIVSLPLRCQELVFAEDAGRSGDKLDLLLSSIGPTLESLVLRNTFDKGSTITLENCPVLRKLKTKAPHPFNGMLTYIDDQAKLIQTVTSPFLSQIEFLGKWDDDPHVDRTKDWLEPVKWEVVDRELCNLMDRLDEEVRLEVVFADDWHWVLSAGCEVTGANCERADGPHSMLLSGVKRRGGVVKIQRGEKLK